MISLHDVPRLLPRTKPGRKIAISTVYRWTAKGIKGVRLETIQVGGRRCTSKQALERFFDALASPEPMVEESRRGYRSPRQRARALAAAQRELDRLLGPREKA
jgi:hypothetical protein